MIIPLIHLYAPVRPSVTFYTGSRQRLANGHSWGQENRSGLFCAANHYRLGTRLLVSRGGRRVMVKVADRGGMGAGIDLCPRAAVKLMGSHYKIVGRVSARVAVKK